MDFFTIKERSARNGVIEVYPDFKILRSKDLMVRAKSFYAIWDEAEGLWSTDEYDVQRLVDEKLREYADQVVDRTNGAVQVKYLGDFSSSSWLQFRNYVGHLTDNSHQLDSEITFADTVVKKEDYVSRRLSYSLQRGSIEAYDELMGTLYDSSERAKLEWAIGAIISGDSQHIQKFIVLHGPAGAGKSTILDIIQTMFPGYYTTFEAKSLTGSSNAFSTEVFRNNPLVAIQHDGDLSRIEDNTKLNSIVSHEEMTMNEKFKPSYTSRINAFLFMGTNTAVKITDAKSGIIRRLIDVSPSGNLLPFKKYQALRSQIEFELGAIAYYCLDVYRSMGKDYYSTYRPLDMMYQTDVFFNFIQDVYDIFEEQDGVTLTQAYNLYVDYCNRTNLEYKMAQYKFREELKNYFHGFADRAHVDGVRVRSYYTGFKKDMFTIQERREEAMSLVLDQTVSIFDSECRNQPAQYASTAETPSKFWSDKERMMINPKTKVQELMVPPANLVCNTVLEELDTSKLHYVKPPLNHIVIDFDLTDDEGNKSAQLNLEAASMWPATYAEFSKGGAGVHLHYIYDGDPTELSRIYSDGIEVKVFVGDSSLRRRLSLCNNVPIATISSGLPLKEKKMLNTEGVKSERSLRNLIERNLKKEIHPGTKPSIDFIHKILEDAYNSGLSYDVTNLRPKILAFANNSSNQSVYCVKLVGRMKFQSEDSEGEVVVTEPQGAAETPIAIFDCEVFPNLLIINWKYRGSDTVVRMINPSPAEVEDLARMRLIGYNCRRYDNHILYARIMGFSNEKVYQLSKRLISNSPNATFREAYNLSYADIYDFAAKKQSLAKWQIELGLDHVELGLDWDQPVPEELWEKVAAYCDNDVITTEKVLDHLDQDFAARKLLADLSGLPVNSSTQAHTNKIIFGDDRKPQDKFIYTDLSEEFPGYEFDRGVSTYRDEIVGEGGLVRAKPGFWENVAVLDIASMHPTTIKVLNMFGPYTKNFVELVEARLAIKHKDFDTARSLLGGALAPYLKNESDAKALSYALKIVINIVYGLTSAKFDNPFRDPRNIDNIVAKRGALFMVDLMNMVEDLGYTVVHIKTDSIKIPNADQKIIDLVVNYGKERGYDFEHEATYEKFGLVNDAVYAAKIGWAEDESLIGTWEVVGAQFKHPYVYKSLFSKEKVVFDDLKEVKSVATSLHLDFNPEDKPMALSNDVKFVGKTGAFVPVTEGGATLLRLSKDGKYDSASGAKGHRWMEASMYDHENLDKIDWDYYHKLVDDAIDNLKKHGDYEWFVS